MIDFTKNYIIFSDDGQNPSSYSIILTLNKMLVLKKIQIDTFSVDNA